MPSFFKINAKNISSYDIMFFRLELKLWDYLVNYLKESQKMINML